MTFGLGGGYKTKQFINQGLSTGFTTIYTCPADTFTIIFPLDFTTSGALYLTSPGGTSRQFCGAGPSFNPAFTIPERIVAGFPREVFNGSGVVTSGVYAGAFCMFPGEMIQCQNSGGSGQFFRYGLLES